MRRSLRAATAVLLVTILASLVPSGAASGASKPAALANEERRQALLHRRWPADGVPGTLILTTTTPEVARELAADEGGQVIGERAVLLHVRPGTESAHAARLVAHGGVVAAEPDRIREPARVPNDPRYIQDEWNHRLTNAQTAWDTTTGDADVTVAVLDTGVDGDHDDLVENLVEQVDLSSGRVLERRLGVDNDTCNVGHGTFVSGVIGAVGDNGIGVAGVAWDVSIVDVALTSRESRCGILDSSIIAGLTYVTVDREGGPVDVVNLSLGGIADACTAAMQTALDDARSRGTLVVASSGNEEQLLPGATSIPASCDGVMSVGAVGVDGNVATYSNQNANVDIAAPGGDTSTGRGVLTTAPGGDYLEVEGTSFASPYVAGVAALLRSVDPDLSPDDLESIMESTAQDRGTSGRDAAYGWGIVDAARAVQAAVAGDPAPPEEDEAFPVQSGGLFIERVARTGTTTEPIAQAVAMSEFTFPPRSAMHAVIARSDDYADALAGSALGLGLGPLLFTRSTGSLAGVTRTELQRVLDVGSTVYLLGGTAALPATLEGELRGLGYEPVRIAGATRVDTSAAVANAIEELFGELGFFVPPSAIVATAFNWPDAVAAGSIAAWFGMPILVTSPTSLDAPIEEYLADHDLDTVYVVGGTAAISDGVRARIRDVTGLTPGNVRRLAGTTRSGTAVAVAREFETLFSDLFESFFGEPAVPNIVAGVNLRRADGFAHVLSASSIIGAGGGGVFIPIEGDRGTSIDAEAQAYVCRFPAFGLVAGGDDLVSDDTARLLDDLMQGKASAC